MSLLPVVGSSVVAEMCIRDRSMAYCLSVSWDCSVLFCSRVKPFIFVLVTLHLHSRRPISFPRNSAAGRSLCFRLLGAVNCNKLRAVNDALKFLLCAVHRRFFLCLRTGVGFDVSLIRHYLRPGLVSVDSSVGTCHLIEELKFFLKRCV